MTLRFTLTGKDPGEEADIPENIKPIIDKATAFDPAARYRSVKEFFTDFRRTIEQQPCKSKMDADTKPRSVHDASDDPKGEQTAEGTACTQQTSGTGCRSVNERGVSKTAPSYTKPRPAWRVLQATASLLGVLCVCVSAEALTGQQTASAVTTFITGIFIFVIPLAILADPFDILRKRGFFEEGTMRRVAQAAGIGFLVVLAACAIESFIAR